jgi:hypothetical protein
MAERVVNPEVVTPKPQVVSCLGDIVPIIVVIDDLPEVVRRNLAVLPHVRREEVVLSLLVGVGQIEVDVDAAHFSFLSPHLRGETRSRRAIRERIAGGYLTIDSCPSKETTAALCSVIPTGRTPSRC